MLIHVSGAPGSGKTTLGHKLAKHYGAKVVVKDLDDLFGDFMKANGKPGQTKSGQIKFSPKKYQTFINSFIKAHTKKPLILVGLNSEHLTNTFYKIPYDYAFYVDLPDDVNLERHFKREAEGWLNWMLSRDKNILLGQLLEDQDKVIDGLTKSLARMLDIAHQRKLISSFAPHYKKEGYQFLTAAKIYTAITKLI
jgi:adenylate kinase family enzyme